MSRNVLLLALFAAVLPALGADPALAKKETVICTLGAGNPPTYEYDEIGNVTAKKLGNGKVRLVFAARANDVAVTCSNSSTTGSMDIAQVFAVVLDFKAGADLSNVKVTGTTVGRFNPGNGSTVGEFRGRVTGTASCAAGVCEVQMSVRGRTRGGARFKIDIDGLFVHSGPGSIPGAWQLTELTGSGQIRKDITLEN